MSVPRGTFTPGAKDPVPRHAYTLDEAADSLGLSLSSFRRHVLPRIKAVRLGACVVVHAAEIDRWLEANGTLNTPTT